MRKLASIQKIKSLVPIEGADRIELAHVLGWQCVAPKGQFSEGDMCVYFEIDSFLPVKPEFEFLRASSFKTNPILGDGFRLKTMKFKGQISQGLVMPLNDVGIVRADNGDRYDNARDYVYRSEGNPDVEMIDLIKTDSFNNLSMEGTDITELLGVREWEIPERASTGGTIKGNLPYCIHKTDETRIQSMPELFEEFKGLPYYITTKYDGSSHSIAIDDAGEFHVTGHNFEYKDDGTSSFYEYVKKNGLEEKLRDYIRAHGIHSITVQGEFCGDGIQKNRLHLKKPEWFVFTVDEDGKRVGWVEICHVANECALKTVDCQETGSDLTATYLTVESLIERAANSAKYTIAYGSGQPEGIVIRPMNPVYSKVLGGDLSMKVINNKYLLKTEG